MSTGAGLAAFGTKLQLLTTGATYVDIAGVTNIKLPVGTVTPIDITNHQSDDGYREFVTGLKEGGDITVDINYLPQTHTVFTDLLNPAVGSTGTKTWRIELPLGHKWDFDALLTGFDISAPVDDKLSATVTLKISGRPILTVAP